MEAKSPPPWDAGSSRLPLATGKQFPRHTTGNSSTQLWSVRPPRYWPEFLIRCRTRTREPGSKTVPTCACQSTRRTDNRSRRKVWPGESLAGAPEAKHYPAAGGPATCRVLQSAGGKHSCEYPAPIPRSGSRN